MNYRHKLYSFFFKLIILRLHFIFIFFIFLPFFLQTLSHLPLFLRNKIFLTSLSTWLILEGGEI